MVISQFGGTQSCYIFPDFGQTWSILNWWNTVISQFGGTWSFLNFVEHKSFSIWWNMVIFEILWNTVISPFWWTTVISQLGGWGWPLWLTLGVDLICGTHSFLNLVEHSHSQIGRTWSFLSLVEHWGVDLRGWTKSFSSLVEHSNFSIWWNTVIT